MRSISQIGGVVLVVTGLLLGAGCSSDSSDTNASGDPVSNTSPEATSGDSSSNNSDGGGNDNPSDSDEPHELEVPTIADGNWTGGDIHVEVTGDRDATFDAPGSGSTLDGVTSAAFTQAPDTVSIGLGGSEESAISLTAGGVSTVGGFRTNCTIDFTKSDASNLAADFECNDLEAIGSGVTETFTIDVQGNFSLTR